MVTGRELDELLALLEEPILFDRIVAENGALVYDPVSKEVRILADPPPARFVEELCIRLGLIPEMMYRPDGAKMLSAGRVIVATWVPHQESVLAVVRDLGLDMQIIFNKEAVMVLPSGVNKATGLFAALADLGLSAHNVVSVGDAENDLALLRQSECAVAVANALPAVKQSADVVTLSPRGAGVSELIRQLLADDLAAVAPDLVRHHIHLGTSDDGRELRIDPYTAGVMVLGMPETGKTTLTTGLIERFQLAGYQFVVIDPEGNYTPLEFAIVLGSSDHAPVVEDVLELLRDPQRNVVVNLVGVAREHRSAFFGELLPALLELRTRTGRPHWLVVDEVHHFLPAWLPPTPQTITAQLHGGLFITVHPENVAPLVLGNVDTLLVVGGEPEKTVAEFCAAVGESAPDTPLRGPLPFGDAVLWRRGEPTTVLVHTEPPRTERQRHSRKFAQGNLGPGQAEKLSGGAG